MITVQDLVEFEAIKQLKYRYMRALDTHDWALMETCFVEDATTWYGSGRYASTGIEQIMALFRALLNPSFVSSHLAVHPEIKLTGESTAEGVWRMEDTVHFTEANPVMTGAKIGGGEEMLGAGYYYDEYVKRAGEWKIKSSGYVRLFERITFPEGRGKVQLNLEPARGVKSP